MKYRALGHTGLIVSEVALGKTQFGGKMNMGNLGQEETTRVVRLALNRGINFIDTADVYSLGESETLLGNALKGIRKEIVEFVETLGELMPFDRNISVSRNQACASCHMPYAGFSGPIPSVNLRQHHAGRNP